ncbi:putative protein spg20 [Golovinomyces cichoracearum]|uniref:Senescence domain-containing protein n=1 Tax=Golovinomyces cichoracearum TaxID=62708 RepID=A0A420J7F7_9PEZI|nr:putative protein spg20 [Golovinomyces cichoracearum]
MTSETLLLYIIPEVNAYQIENNVERLLTSEGPQMMSLLMVPVTSTVSTSVPEGNLQLQLSLAPDLDFILSAATSLHSQPPRSYLISRPKTKSGTESLIRIEFPSESQRKSVHDDMDTFESILAQCNVNIQHNITPLAPYDPSQYKSENKRHKNESSETQGQIVIIDEDNGDVLGELGSGFTVVDDTKMKPGTNGPVEITLPADDSGKIKVTPASEPYLGLALNPIYKNSTLVSKATTASRLIVTTSDYVTKTLQSQADSFTQKTKPNPKPLKFQPVTHDRIRKVCHITENAAGISSKTVRQVQKYAHNIGASVSKRDKTHTKASNIGPDGKTTNSYKPGLINQGLVAFSTLADGIDHAGRSILSGTSTAVSTVVGHRYGPEAGEITKNIGGGVRNVGLVYIDASGISRRAIVKSLVKGMVVGKLPNGENLVVGSEGNDLDKKSDAKIDNQNPTSSQYRIDTPNVYEKEEQKDKENTSYHGMHNSPHSAKGKFEKQAPPAYTTSVSGDY